MITRRVLLRALVWSALIGGTGTAYGQPQGKGSGQQGSGQGMCNGSA